MYLLCVCVWGETYWSLAIAHVWRSEDCLWDFFLSFHHMGRAQVVRLRAKNPSEPSLLPTH